MHRTGLNVFLRLVASFGWVDRLRGLDVPRAILGGQPRATVVALYSEPPTQEILEVQKGSLIEMVKGVFGLPDSPLSW